MVLRAWFNPLIVVILIEFPKVWETSVFRLIPSKKKVYFVWLWDSVIW